MRQTFKPKIEMFLFHSTYTVFDLNLYMVLKELLLLALRLIFVVSVSDLNVVSCVTLILQIYLLILFNGLPIYTFWKLLYFVFSLQNTLFPE